MEANLQMKLTTLIFFAAIFSLMILIKPSLQYTTPIKYCDKKANYAVKVEGVDMIPYPVVSGQPATFKISASSGQPISGGKLSLQVYFWGIRVHSESHDICEESSCPISAGKFVLSHTQVLPGIAPPGSYTLKMRMTDESNNQLTCISFNFKISWGSYDSALWGPEAVEFVWVNSDELSLKRGCVFSNSGWRWCTKVWYRGMNKLSVPHLFICSTCN